ncbi:MAG TPA: hypothetical protein VMI56_22430 [Reyranella sp.]|nr:hypothetical protein [Reyranella sp.]
MAEAVPLSDARDGLCRERALAVREACLGWLPCGDLLARLGDPVVRWWLRRTNSPYVAEIEATARALECPGTWLLHGAYLFGCTALADDTPRGPRLRRTLDWPFTGLGRLVEVVRQRGPAGEFLNVTWSGFSGVLTAMAPGRFAASINQAPMRRRNKVGALLWFDYVLNAVGALFNRDQLPEHLLRHVFESCATFDDARHLLMMTPVARPVLFLLVGCTEGDRLVIERDGASARAYRHFTALANDWQEDQEGWRPRCCGLGPPGDNNRRRRSTLAAWSGRDANDFTWVSAPVLNECTRLAVEMCPASERLLVQGWEPDGLGSAQPATVITSIQARPYS